MFLYRTRKNDFFQILSVFPVKGLIFSDAQADAEIQPQGGIIGQKGHAGAQADALNLSGSAVSQQKFQGSVPAIAAAHQEKDQQGIAAEQPRQYARENQQAGNSFAIHGIFPLSGWEYSMA